MERIEEIIKIDMKELPECLLHVRSSFYKYRAPAA